MLNIRFLATVACVAAVITAPWRVCGFVCESDKSVKPDFGGTLLVSALAVTVPERGSLQRDSSLPCAIGD